MTWYLVSKEVYEEVRDVLLDRIRRQQDECSESGCYCDIDTPRCWQHLMDALHSLDSGLHSTDAIPSDEVAE